MAYIKGHPVTVTPNNITEHEKTHRREFHAILSGFHHNTLGQDLHDLIQDFNIKNLVIPRITFQYRQRPWAHVFFASQEQKDHAMECTISFAGRQLFWTEPTANAPLCNECGSPNYLLKDCDKRRRYNCNSRAQSNRWTDVMQNVNKDERARSQSSARSQSQLRTRFNNRRTKPNLSYAGAAKRRPIPN